MAVRAAERKTTPFPFELLMLTLLYRHD